MTSDQCQRCNKVYEAVWQAPDDMWDLVRDDYDILCMHCFDELAWDRGLYLHWACEAERYPLETEILQLETRTIGTAELIQRLRRCNEYLVEQ